MAENESNGSVTSSTKDYNLLEGTYPPGVPLTARYKLGFGYVTINQRLPIILTKVIDQLSRDKNEIANTYSADAKEEIKTITGALAKLKNEMITNKPVSKVGDAVWDSYLLHIADKYFDGDIEKVTWYFTTWLHVECYFYKRIDNSFKLTQHLRNFDPFRKQKEEGFSSSRKAASLLGEFVVNSDSSDTVLETLLEVSLWGNRCDLSLSAGKDVSQIGNLVDQLKDLREFILCDDSANFWKILREAREGESKNKPVTIGFVLDNCGFELFTDFCFADKLMDRVDRVDFYVKAMPWFVSDTMTHDFHWLLDHMASCSDLPALVSLAEKWKGYVTTGRWTVVEKEFWTYPHAYHEMTSGDSDLYKTLSLHTHLIFKGDLNYRKLIGDVSWSPETPFKDALQGFCPAPLLTLRTLKADCIAGLRKGVAEEVQAKSSDWLITGEYGVLQHAQ